MDKDLKPLHWIGSTLEDLKAMPDEVRRNLGFGLDQAQRGGKSPDAKPLKGFSGTGVLELVEDFKGDTYRGVYTVKFENTVYVLHVFQKKSKSGIKTPKQEIELIKSRLKQAEEDFLARKAKRKT
jgi:phage-related protein